MSDTTRAGYIAGLRQLADMLEQNPDVQLPYGAGTGDRAASRLTFYFLTDADPKAQLVRMARLFPGKVRKENDGDTYSVVGAFAGLHAEAVAYRSAVCERIVTGTETVTEEVHDPEALATVPKITVTREVEQVEWRCHPLLADATAEQVPA